MENLELIISIATGIVAFVSAVIGLGIKLHKTIKERNLEEWGNFFIEQANKYVVLAEDIKNFEGKDKKEWVMTKINQACIDAGIPFDKMKVDKIIEGVVLLTKQVNKRDKDKGVLI